MRTINWQQNNFSSDVVNDVTAYAYCDTYSILDSNEQCIGCEHNQSEAEALISYLSNYHGKRYLLRRNTPDQVRAAKKWYPQPLRHPAREIAFETLGVGK